MRNELLVAPRSAMVIRIVEPATLIRRSVVEQRPLSLRSSAVMREKTQSAARDFVFCMAICAAVLIAFSYVITCALDHFLKIV